MYESRRDTDAQLRRFLDVLARQRAQLEARLAELRSTLDEVVAQESAAQAGAAQASEDQAVSSRAAFPAALTDARAFAIAQAMLDGFDRHYRLFRAGERARPRQRFEAADWHGQQRAQRERIEFYDQRVDEAAERLQTRVQGRRAADGGLAAGQAALHRPADQPPPARAAPRPSSTR